MAKVEFGYVVPLEGTPQDQRMPLMVELQQKVLPVAARYFDSLWVYDHFYGFSQPTNPYLECWTSLAWLAARYPEALVGTMVMGVGYRNPALVAKMGATLQAISRGRLVLGIGAGWREQEYHAYGFPFPEPAERIRQLEEAVHIIRKMWTEEAPSFKGEYYEIRDAYCPPQPRPQPPILIGGEGEQLMLPLVGRLADWWNVGDLSKVEDYRRKRDIVYRSAVQAGRDPAQIRLTNQIMNRSWPESEAQSRQWVAFLMPLVNLGFDYFMVDCGPPASIEVLDRFAEEVIAAVNAEVGG